MLTNNARQVLEARYLQPTELPNDMFRRVANHVASCEPPDQQRKWAEEFYNIMESLDFLPNSPTLMNAGLGRGSLSACFVLPVNDSMEAIMEGATAQALVQKFGGGTGFSFSRLRAKGKPISSTHGSACGPISVLQHYDDVSRMVTQGGAREGANMGVLAYNHPDILSFIHAKDNVDADGRLRNFNISVAIDDTFMEAVSEGSDFELVDPHTGPTGTYLNAADVFTAIAESAWTTGDPGLLFMERINKSSANPVPSIGPIDATNPCGEQPLYDWDVCNLGSINLANFVPTYTDTKDIDYDELAKVIAKAVRFLDNVIETNYYPEALPMIEERAKSIRRIGLGVMGWADMLYKLRIRYDSVEAIKLAARLGSFIRLKADEASAALASERGTFPLFDSSIYSGGMPLRNSTRTTIAPTGTISIIAGTSSGIEPNFALEFVKHSGHNIDDMVMRNPVYQEWLDNHPNDSIPDYFVVSHGISPDWHLEHQAIWQRYTDNAVSKTINLPQNASVADIEYAYKKAYDLGCLGITVYRDNSRTTQVLARTDGKETESAAVDVQSPTNSGSPKRRHLPAQRPAVNHKVIIGGHECYISVGFFEDGSPGEVFINLSKEGSTVQGLANTAGILGSLALQYGVNPADLSSKFRGTSFEPAGLTNNPEIPTSSSIADYVFRFVESVSRFSTPRTEVGRQLHDTVYESSTGGGCPDCGSMLVHEEGCEKCHMCGFSRC